jgi:hypothetical protein
MYIAVKMPQRESIMIHLLLVGLILIPVHYYACNADKRDERFAWRMFSPTRVEKCSAQFYVGDAPRAIRTSQHFHNAWVGVAQRGRRQVIEAMAQALCERNPDTAVRVRVQCEQSPNAAFQNRALLYDPNQDESSEKIELVSRGLFDFCVTGSL